MGLPKISIAFKTAGITAIQRGQRGTVALIMKDNVDNGPKTITAVDEIPSGLSDDNKEQISLAMKGAVNPPQKILAYILPLSSTTYTEATNYLQGIKWDYLAVPSIDDKDKEEIAIWIKQLRDTKNKKVKAILPNYKGDHEGLINFATDGIMTPDKIYNAKQYCSRIAGILAGIPLTTSATYQALPEIEDVPHLSEAELNTAIDDGQLILFNDGEKVKIARAVNSLTSTTTDKGEDFKKIKIIDILDLIYDDIRRTAEDSFIGKVANSYDNKCILMSSIQAYFEALETD
jgi:hypothetical protein